MNFTSHWGIARRLYLASSLLIAGLVLVANAAWISLTLVDDLSRQVAVNSVPGPDQQALAEIGLQARGARTRVSVMVVAVALGLLAFSWYISRMLLRRVATAQHMAERVRAGDLTRVDIDKTHDEFHSLLLALGSMQSALMNVVRNVRHGAESVATASVEIAQGNRDLSRRTEEQAVALEETADSMTQLNGIVRKNADGALLARQLAQDASAVAAHAGDVVEQVMDTMQGIDDSARNIVDIIQVIDGIAFQTNILALNAAVEAARAGEQGRGFAVVAGEVRGLARRSADAARQIKQLVNTSVARAGQGSALATDAGNAMQQVVSAIARVTRIMEEISAASLQQSCSLSRVSDTVTQMGRSTQQNAALVEQISAAADSLGTQAQAQVQGVAVFRLDRIEERDATPVPGVKMPVVFLSGEVKKNTSSPRRCLTVS